MYIHSEGSLPDEADIQTVPFNLFSSWASKDWESFFSISNDSSPWTVVWVARGGMILLDLVENRLDDYIWTYVKPKVIQRPHEDPDVFEEYTDPALEDKILEYYGESTSLLFIEDLVDTGDNLEFATDYILEIAEENQIEVPQMATIALATRMSNLGSMPIYGILASIDTEIRTSWGNDYEHGLDYKDFSEIKEYLDDH